MINTVNIDNLKAFITTSEIALALLESYNNGIYSYQEIADLLGITKDELFNIYNTNGVYVWDNSIDSLNSDLTTITKFLGNKL